MQIADSHGMCGSPSSRSNFASHYTAALLHPDSGSPFFSSSCYPTTHKPTNTPSAFSSPLFPKPRLLSKSGTETCPPGPACSPPLLASSRVPGTLSSTWPLLEDHPPFSFTEAGPQKTYLPSHKSAVRCRVVAKGTDFGITSETWLCTDLL